MKPDLRSFLPSVLRTVVPFVVTIVAGWPITQALGISGEQLTVAVAVAVGGLYWLLVRVLEVYVVPQFGWLLGWASPPVYVDPAQTGKTPTAAGDVVRVVTRAR